MCVPPTSKIFFWICIWSRMAWEDALLLTAIRIWSSPGSASRISMWPCNRREWELGQSTSRSCIMRATYNWVRVQLHFKLIIFGLDVTDLDVTLKRTRLKTRSKCTGDMGKWKQRTTSSKYSFILSWSPHIRSAQFFRLCLVADESEKKTRLEYTWSKGKSYQRTTGSKYCVLLNWSYAG